MQVEERPSLKDIVSSLEEAQQRLSDADLIGAARAARPAARGAGPDGVGGRVGGPGSPAPSWA
jgi:hypothetical protein